MIYARATYNNFIAEEEWATFPDVSGNLAITAKSGNNVFIAAIDGTVINVQHVVLNVPDVALDQAFANTGQSLKDQFGL